MYFIISSLIWFSVFLPMVLISFPVVAIMLLTRWDGRSTWFGNFKYEQYLSPASSIDSTQTTAKRFANRFIEERS